VKRFWVMWGAPLALAACVVIALVYTVWSMAWILLHCSCGFK
jgi:hypothetical protein